jgi:uncharacterized protein (UPF0548 family)
MIDRNFSYSEVGQTRNREPVDGYRMTDVTRVVGYGIDAFQRAVECVVSLSMHRAAGLDVAVEGAQVTEGTNLVLGLPVGPFTLRAPCRVVYVIDHSNMGGFAYGTLTGHPERGEARFEVSMDDREVVSMRIFSFSQAATRISRIGGPVTRRIQSRVNRRYLDAVEVAAQVPS